MDRKIRLAVIFILLGLMAALAFTNGCSSNNDTPSAVRKAETLPSDIFASKESG